MSSIYKSPIYKLWFWALLVKLVVGAFLPLFHDETYYWFWSHQLQLSYYDHPPLVGWLFRLGHIFEDFGSAVRWPGIVLAHFSLLIWIELLKEHLSSEQLKWWLWLSLTLPLLGPGSLIITPDIPLLFFWSLSIFTFLKAAKTQKASWYLAMGLSLGFGFLSKYHIVLFPLCALPWLFMQKIKPRAGLLLLAILGFVLGSLPVWIWNYNNDFASFTFQLKHGLKPKNWYFYYPALYLLGQALLITPWVLWSSLKKSSLKAVSLEPLGWLIPFSWVPVLFFLVSSFKALPEANWAIPAFPSFAALSVIGLTQFRGAWRTCVFCGVVFVGALTLAFFPESSIYQGTKLKEFTEFDPIVDVVDEYSPAYFRSYQMASKVSFEKKRIYYKLRKMNRPDFYDYLDGSLPKPKSKYFFFVEKGELLPYWARPLHTIKSRKAISDRFDVLEVSIND